MHIINQIIAVFAKSSLSGISEDADVFDNNYDDVHLWI